MMKDIETKILQNEQVNTLWYLLKVKYSLKLLPGQFVNVKLNDQIDPFLRRPISVHDWDASKKELSLLYKVVGKGTKYLSGQPKGANLKILGPLGNTFDLKGLNKDQKVALIGGGIGIAPLLYLGKALAGKGVKFDTYTGYKNKAEVYISPQLKKLSKKVIIATDNGSAGQKGFITDVFQKSIAKNKYDLVFVCGPEIMMKKAVQVCKPAKIDIQVSMESIMGCGIGACMCCVTESLHGYKKVCSDGPVFKPEELGW
jgi:dihydroorotate dehydrogenase electron transfer subunit